jgi:uncharacterized membrane protein
MHVARQRKTIIRDPAAWICAAALVALFIKLAIAFATIGTNDVETFYTFSRALSDHGLQWTYEHDQSFNHPPLVAYFLRAIYAVSHIPAFEEIGLTFPFLLRLPGIISDFAVVLLLVGVRKEFSLPIWSLLVLALSPVSVMVAGFHGNTDPVVVMFLILATYMCLRERPVLCGIFLALSCQIKVIPLLLLPIIFFFWWARGAALRFTIPFALLCVTAWAEPLLKFPTLFLTNVLSYGSFWGVWGITYWLRLTQWEPFNGTGAFNMPVATQATAFLLKVMIVAGVVVIAWRRRILPGRAVIDSIAYSWIIFFVFSPGISVQYMVWLAPFILVLSPTLYAWLAVTSSGFLFFFYNSITGGLPWYFGTSKNSLEALNVWIAWSLWPWAALCVGLMLLWQQAKVADSSLRLFSFQTLRADVRE